MSKKKHKPPIVKDGVLIIPSDSNPMFHWWAGGMKPSRILEELGYPELIAQYKDPNSQNPADQINVSFDLRSDRPVYKHSEDNLTS